MLITQKMCVGGTLTQKIVNVPLPSQQAAKILQELQTSCNSPNKATQLEALKCWGAWIQNHGPEEWDNDSVCHFAVKPLSTKKVQALHKDIDICKLKLSLLWELLKQVQGKMELKGSQHILKIFLQTSFAWLSSIDTLDNKIIVLIVKLLLSLFKKFEGSIICDMYTFSSIQIDDSVVRKFFHIFNDDILDVFDNWKKVQDNSLIMKLWTCFLEYCECVHENITTSIWHRIFKVNQAFCLDHSESVKDRLIFLHACATNVKTVLLSSKYIGGESCFTTPCEALMKKLVEVCSNEIEEVPDGKMFSMCKDTSEVLANESVAISEYEMCIYLVEHLEDFAYKSFLWGAWCGLVDCFKKNLMNVGRQTFTRNQSKFYRKLRGVSVNFELDKIHLTPDSVTLVQSSIEILKIGCSCGGLKTPELSTANSAIREENVVPLKESMEMDFHDDSLPVVSLQMVKKVLPFTSGEYFGKFPNRTASNKPSLSVYVDFGFKNNFFEFSNRDRVKILITTPFHFPLPVFDTIKTQYPLVPDLCSIDSKRNIKMLTYDRSESSRLQCSESNKAEKVLETEEKKEEICVSRTRGRRKAEKKDAEETVKRKRRKSFEVLINEIVTKNKLRKSEKNTKGKKNGGFERKELRSGKQLRDSEEEIVPKRQLRERKVAEGKPSTNNSHGKLEHFFKVVDSKTTPNKAKKTPKQVKKEKSEINWKQSSLTGMMSPKMFEKEKKNSRTQTKANKILKTTPAKKISETNNLMATSPFKEALQDHEYAKPLESYINSDSDKGSKKQGSEKKVQKIGEASDAETAELETSILDKPEQQTISTPKKVKEDSTLDKLKIKTEDDGKLGKSASRKSKTEIVDIKKTEKRECDVSLRAHLIEEKSDKQIISDSYVEASKEKNIFDVKSPEESVTIVKCENNPAENICSDVEETEEEGLHENIEGKNYFLNNMKKRMLVIYSPRPKKKARFHEDSLDGNGDSVDVAEKENRELENLRLDKSRGMLSPIKESFAESSALKEEISPNKKSPFFSRTTSSRALRMIALIPEPSSPVGNQTNCEIASKTGCKHHLKKFIGVDKSSRVSKMLARLSESMKQEGEDLTNGKLISEDSPPPVTTPTSLKFTPENISPKPVKKKKFIGFDDSKNETIIFQTDTPPSQILEQRILLRDC